MSMNTTDSDEVDDRLIRTGDVDLEYEIGEQSPFVVIPRGGAQEVGRSCYQVETQTGTYLVDAGLNQGSGGLFPDLRGISEGQIDAVFLTHAHIDHIGALPVLESHGLLNERAPVIATRPTEALADTLLRDSLKLHRMKCEESGREQLYTAKDVRAVLDRFIPRGYIQDEVKNYASHIDGTESLTFQFGNAGHLLGSAWIALAQSGTSVVFSGDVGGRSNHLPDIDTPPKADKLILEATYGGSHSHPSASDTRTEIYKHAVESAVDGRPVLIPSFGVGRSQELLYMFANRMHSLSDEERDQIGIYYDGMAVGATDSYNAHARGEFAAESIRNKRVNSGDKQPFLFDSATAGYDTNREEILAEDSDETPIIISPSGMLSGGFSPVYLLEMAERYDEAELLLCGYQAEGTPGRVLEEARESNAEEVEITLPANPFGEGIPEDDGTETTIPTDWISRYHGLSAHAARNTLLEFTRQVSPHEVTLVHGQRDAQLALADHLANNAESVVGVSLAGMMYPTPVSPAPDLDDVRFADRPATQVLDEKGEELSVASDTQHRDVDDLHADLSQVVKQVNTLEDVFRTLDAQVARTRQEGWTEEEIREVVRDEQEEMIREIVEEVVDKEGRKGTI